MGSWQFIISKPAAGRDNMELDLKLFREANQPTIRIYSWANKCISVGYGQNAERLLDGSVAGLLGWEIVKRPTGGGLVFHNEVEVTFSVVCGVDELPAGLLPSYYKISEAVVSALKQIGVEAELQTSNNKLQSNHQPQTANLCFAYPAEYEIVCQEKKIVGSAQKRNRTKLLQQGSIFVKNPGLEVLSILKNPDEELNAISVEEVLKRGVSFEEMGRALRKGFEEVLGVGFWETD